jgi:flavorubredoxin
MAHRNLYPRRSGRAANLSQIPSAPERRGVVAQIDEITKGVYRIATPPKEFVPISFNQFLIDDEMPALIHTGVHSEYDSIRGAIGEVLDPARLAYVVLLHFEGDECGGMDRFMAEAPNAQLVGSGMSAILNLTAFGVDYVDRVRGVIEGDKIELGERTLRFIETPHVHHWDSMMVFEESTKSLFPSDLFIQPGDQPSVVNEDLTAAMCAYYREIGIFAHEEPVRETIDRLVQLDPEWIHAMHGGTLTGEIFPRYVKALREERFAFEGKSLGRPIVEPAAAEAGR